MTPDTEGEGSFFQALNCKHIETPALLHKTGILHFACVRIKPLYICILFQKD